MVRMSVRLSRGDKVPGCSTWEQTQELSNNKDTGLSDHESLKGSLDQDCDAVEMGLQH